MSTVPPPEAPVALPSLPPHPATAIAAIAASRSANSPIGRLPGRRVRGEGFSIFERVPSFFD